MVLMVITSGILYRGLWNVVCCLVGTETSYIGFHWLPVVLGGYQWLPGVSIWFLVVITSP